MLRNVTALHGHKRDKQKPKPLLSKGYEQNNTFVWGEVQLLDESEKSGRFNSKSMGTSTARRDSLPRILDATAIIRVFSLYPTVSFLRMSGFVRNF
jgi:hypothetical protein